MIKIYLFKNTNILSKLICWQTRSPYSHAAISVDGVAYESVRTGVKRLSETSMLEHYSGIEYDIFEFVNPPNSIKESEVQNFLGKQVGKSYDISMIIRFLTRDQETRKSKEKWFCSELVYAAASKVTPLLNGVEPWMASPAMISYSPLLKKREN